MFVEITPNTPQGSLSPTRWSWCCWWRPWPATAWGRAWRRIRESKLRSGATRKYEENADPWILQGHTKEDHQQFGLGWDFDQGKIYLDLPHPSFHCICIFSYPILNLSLHVLSWIWYISHAISYRNEDDLRFLWDWSQYWHSGLYHTSS